MAKKKPTPGTTTPSQFRLGAETLALIDALAKHLGDGVSRTDVVRQAVQRMARAEKIPEKNAKRVLTA